MKYNIDAIKSSITIPQLLRKMGIDCPDGAKMINAPHRDERTPSCSITDNGRRWHDFGTGDGSDVIDMYAAITGKSMGEAIEDMAKMTGVGPGESDIDGSPISKIPKPPKRNPLGIESSEISLESLRAMRWNLKCFLDEGKDCKALQSIAWIPEEHLLMILRKGWLGATFDGRLAYLMRRGIKIRNEPTSSRGDRWKEGKGKDNLFVSFNDADIYKTGCDRLMLCEGESDTIAATIMFGHEYKVAGCLSASALPPPEMLYPLLRGTKHVVITFDGDDAGRGGAQRVAKHVTSMASAMKVHITEMPDGEDIKSMFLTEQKKELPR